MDFDPHKLAHQFGEYGSDWADKKAAADLLIRTSKHLRARIALEKLPEAGSVSKAELNAEASQEYDEQCRTAIEAQKQENLAWIKFEQIKTYIDLIRSQESSRRAEMSMR